MAQGQNNNSGFSLPAPTDAPASGVQPTITPAPTAPGASMPAPASSVPPTVPAASTAASNGTMTVPPTVTTDSSQRDLLIGGGVIAVLLIVLFFVKNAYANRLVAKRVAPNQANAASWWLYVFLASVSSGVVLFLVNPHRFMTPIIFGVLCFLSIVSLVLMLVTGRK